MQLFLGTIESLWQVVLVALLFGAGLPTIFAVGIRLMASVDADGEATRRRPVATVAGVLCFAVVLAAVVTGILYISSTFLDHTFGIEIF